MPSLKGLRGFKRNDCRKRVLASGLSESCHVAFLHSTETIVLTTTSLIMHIVVEEASMLGVSSAL